MAAAWYRAQRQWRSRWRSLALLALVGGVAGGAVLSTAAGARRSDSAYGRLARSTATSDVIVQQDPLLKPSQIEAVRGLHEVAGVSYALFLLVRPLGDKSRFGEDVGAVASPDGSFGHATDRSRLVAGRRADPSRADEITVNERVVAFDHLRVGDRLTLESLSKAQIVTLFQGGQTPAHGDGPPSRVTVVGVERRAVDLSQGDIVATLYPSVAWVRRYGARIASFEDLLVHLRPPAAAPEVSTFRRHAATVLSREGFQVGPLNVDSNVGHATHLEATALGLFALCAALAGLVAVAEALNRQVVRDVEDDRTCRAIGFSRRQQVLTALAIVAPALVAGTVLGLPRRSRPHLSCPSGWPAGPSRGPASASTPGC